ncbi:regulatory protein RecX [Marinoscillum furvescens]|uniref:Regulatory protein RecX n=1 Tax=Marinoscillum furvescens DSM 4134 TaxID=1122208 RepID=A0A3D9L4C0_MARFU|nr:regulatory protein RecX [Marinoscillum furvescens]RED98846.1 regulatory protein [Marinoscillum furvescens DSM 4134]
MERSDLLKHAKAKAAKYCAGRERSPKQVLDKCQAWELTEEEALELLQQLVHERFVDEHRFARAFCHDKFEFNQWGKIRIRQELSRHQVSESAMSEGLTAISDERYEQVLQDLASRKWESLHREENDWVRKQKTMAYLMRKGFEMSLVSSITDQLPHTNS